jgi:hypothetical protein
MDTDRSHDPVNRTEFDLLRAERANEQAGGRGVVREPVARQRDALALQRGVQHQVRRREPRTATDIERSRAALARRLARPRVAAWVAARAARQPLA